MVTKREGERGGEGRKKWCSELNFCHQLKDVSKVCGTQVLVRGQVPLFSFFSLNKTSPGKSTGSSIFLADNLLARETEDLFLASHFPREEHMGLEIGAVSETRGRF